MIVIIMFKFSDFNAFLQGKDESRPAPELPSELRMMKYKNMASVQKLAAKVLKEKSENAELAIEVSN